MTRRWLSLLVAQALLRLTVRGAVLVLAAAAAIALAPASVVATAGLTAAWLGGWPPRRLLAAAAWCAPMVAVWLAGIVLAGRGWPALATAPLLAWHGFWRLALTGAMPAAVAVSAPAAIPVGLLLAAAAWRYRIAALAAGAAGLSPAAAVAFDQRQWRHQVRSARARVAAPGSVPILLRGGLLPVGAVIRSVGHRTGPIAAIGPDRMRSHQVLVGTTGTGKTTLLLRLWAGFMASGLRAQAVGTADPPLLVVLDCKGGADARRVADRVRRVLRGVGVRSVAIWPDETGLSLWSLPPRQLTTTLVDLIEHGTGGAAYYADVLEALVALAVEAPCGPPASAADLLGRLEIGWLSTAYATAADQADLAMLRAASSHLGDVALRFRTLFRRLGGGLDGPASFGDADAWYCILEGTDQVSVAEGQARALVDLLTSFAVRGPARRQILLCVDEFSAVSRRLPIWQLFERARSAGLAVQVSAQSWQGLGVTEDERRRIAAAAEGGIWLLRTPDPEPLTGLAGSRPVVTTSRRLLRFPVWAHQGTSALHEVPVADPGLIRRLAVGQVAYLYRGGVTYIQVKRLVAAPAAVGPGVTVRGPARPAADQPGADQAGADQAGGAGAGRGGFSAAPGGEPGGGDGLPEAGEILDAAFGPEPGR
jgi:hypothetical protein